MKKILLLIIVSFAFLSGLSAQQGLIELEKADKIVLERMSQETLPHIVYAKNGVQDKMTITTANGKPFEINYSCWVYYIRYTDTNQGCYLIVKAEYKNNSLLEVVNSSTKPDDLDKWRMLGAQNYDIYKNHNISACEVNDPLQNIEWLKEYCENLNGRLIFSSVYIYLYKVIDKDEHVVLIETKYDRTFFTAISSVTLWMNCIGELIIGMAEGGPPSPELEERYKEFLKDKEKVAELFHFIKK